MESFTHTNRERSLNKISEFLNVSEDLLYQQSPELMSKMIEAADDDKMFEVHQFGLEMTGRF
jgi:hypothetical protein